MGLWTFSKVLCWQASSDTVPVLWQWGKKDAASLFPDGVRCLGFPLDLHWLLGDRGEGCLTAGRWWKFRLPTRLLAEKGKDASLNCSSRGLHWLCMWGWGGEWRERGRLVTSERWLKSLLPCWFFLTPSCQEGGRASSWPLDEGWRFSLWPSLMLLGDGRLQTRPWQKVSGLVELGEGGSLACPPALCRWRWEWNWFFSVLFGWSTAVNVQMFSFLLEISCLPFPGPFGFSWGFWVHWCFLVADFSSTFSGIYGAKRKSKGLTAVFFLSAPGL